MCGENSGRTYSDLLGNVIPPSFGERDVEVKIREQKITVFILYTSELFEDFYSSLVSLL